LENNRYRGPGDYKAVREEAGVKQRFVERAAVEQVEQFHHYKNINRNGPGFFQSGAPLLLIDEEVEGAGQQ